VHQVVHALVVDLQVAGLQRVLGVLGRVHLQAQQVDAWETLGMQLARQEPA
jgi:hypothetical protein